MKANKVWIIFTDENELYFKDETLALMWYDYYYNILEDPCEMEERFFTWDDPPNVKLEK